jgi:putative ABC transport system ATP-binding protein
MTMFDLVCGMHLEGPTEHGVEAGGATRSFCSPHCLADFRRDQKKYLEQEPVIRLEDVWKTYSLGKTEVSVLRGLSMRIYAGDLVALVGPSGSGKSTALNIIGTLDTATRGLVRIGGQDVSGLAEDRLAALRAKKIGFIFQQFNLVPSLSAAENVMLPRLLQGAAVDDARRKAEDLLASVGLGKRTTHKPSELSGGEQQRVAIARSLMNDPEIIVADEPTGNLDSTTSGRIIDLLVDLWKRSKKTIIIVTHDPHVASHAERVLNFMDGRLIRNHGLAEKAIWKGKAHHDGGV